MISEGIPEGWEVVRSTPEFDETSVPAGLLRAHEVADAVWGRLVVRSGSLGFTFDDDGVRRDVSAGGTVAIPPGRRHHLTCDAPVTFVVEFYRAP